MKENSSKSIPNFRQMTYLGKRPAIDISNRTSVALSKNSAKGGPKNAEKLVRSEEMTPGTMPRPRTIFKIGKTGYKENDFGDGVIASKKNLDTAAPYANSNTEETCYAVMTQPEEEQLP